MIHQAVPLDTAQTAAITDSSANLKTEKTFQKLHFSMEILILDMFDASRKMHFIV